MQIQALPHSSSAAASLSPKVEKAAREFEAILLTTLLNSLQKTMVSLPGGGGNPTENSYSQFGIEALASGICAAGGLGISRMLIEHLQSPKTR